MLVDWFFQKTKFHGKKCRTQQADFHEKTHFEIRQFEAKPSTLTGMGRQDGALDVYPKLHFEFQMSFFENIFYLVSFFWIWRLCHFERIWSFGIPFLRIPICARGFSNFQKVRIPFLRIPILSRGICNPVLIQSTVTVRHSIISGISIFEENQRPSFWT